MLYLNNFDYIWQTKTYKNMNNIFEKAKESAIKIKLIHRFLNDIQGTNVPMKVINRYKKTLYAEEKKLDESIKCIQKEYPPEA